jgi:hypothetical protein
MVRLLSKLLGFNTLHKNATLNTLILLHSNDKLVAFQSTEKRSPLVVVSTIGSFIPVPCA